MNASDIPALLASISGDLRASETDRLDAARYRWLRAQGEAQTLMDNGGSWFVLEHPLPADPDTLDAAIDREMNPAEEDDEERKRRLGDENHARKESFDAERMPDLLRRQMS